MNNRLEYYKDHTIIIQRNHDWEDWYIQVTAPSGCYCYDGWWQGSAYRSGEDAIVEAKLGACIDEDETP